MAARDSSSKPTPGQLWRSRRNLVIAAAYLRLGFSQRFLADVFDLPRTRIASIVAEVRERADEVAEKVAIEESRPAFFVPVLRPDRLRKRGHLAPRKS